eukprot:TRINITY_DN20261_c0_g2_i3.p1 TRINITY_DN20261_c0_g2~~TRINITY_DN20261_c0_g2_i3.p1  ORF type:complete len:671 (-),score=238.49 TRINITY_DN20261_c0_g2_i3:175-2187(-)
MAASTAFNEDDFAPSEGEEPEPEDAAATAATECSICKQPLSEAAAQALACSHCFHEECLENWRRASGCSMEVLRCPVCKRSHADLVAAESQVLPQPPSQVASNLDAMVALGAEFDTVIDADADAPADGETSVRDLTTQGAPIEQEAREADLPTAVETPRVSENAAAATGQAVFPSGSAAAPKAKAKAGAKAGAKAAAKAAGAKSKSAAKSAPKSRAKAKAKTGAGSVLAAAAKAAARQRPAVEEEALREPGAVAEAAGQASNVQEDAAATDAAGDQRVAANAAATAPGDRTPMVSALPMPSFLLRRSGPEIRCGYCIVETDITKLKLCNKGTAKWKCASCKNVLQTLYRKTGTCKLSHIPPHILNEFFRTSARETPDGIKAKGEKLMKSYTVNEEFFAENGSFLPLSVWKTKGFSEAKILQDATEDDIRRNLPMLGDCYRVKILTIGHRGHKGEEIGELDRVKKRKSNFTSVIAQARADAADERAAHPVKDEVQTEGEEEEDSESESTSSSSSDKKKKKRKAKKKAKKAKAAKRKKLAKAAAEKKALQDVRKKEKEDAVASANVQKKKDASCKLAVGFLTKVAAAQAELDKLVADVRFGQLPAPTVTSARDAHRSVHMIMQSIVDVNAKGGLEDWRIDDQPVTDKLLKAKLKKALEVVSSADVIFKAMRV